MLCWPVAIEASWALFLDSGIYCFTSSPCITNNSLYVFVNSFIECEHYVTGGWNYIPKQNSEYLLQNQIGVFLVIAFVTYLFIKRKAKLKYD